MVKKPYKPDDEAGTYPNRTNDLWFRSRPVDGVTPWLLVKTSDLVGAPGMMIFSSKGDSMGSQSAVVAAGGAPGLPETVRYPVHVEDAARDFRKLDETIPNLHPRLENSLRPPSTPHIHNTPRFPSPQPPSPSGRSKNPLEKPQISQGDLLWPQKKIYPWSQETLLRNRFLDHCSMPNLLVVWTAVSLGRPRDFEARLRQDKH